ncbi:LytR C-terminal domain-containing protein [Microbacterium thalassium]|uniref:LytR C-terminal domain-containing protein n=1 Tax=Microbacterium TaxID=33882 RepID=UPI00146F2B8A|nr:LytR C-terminal domain-containing protein [Microbacterium thalassium]
MPRTTYPRDRFDDLPDVDRVGAHRAENPRMRGWVVLLWAALATIILIVVGIFATLLVSGRIELFPAPTPTAAAPTAEVTPVVDTTYQVVILNATPEQGLATQMKDTVVAAGWPDGSVLPSDASADDFPETTVYYVAAEDEAAAAGLAQVVGGARIEQSEVYQPADAGTKQLTVVIGLDRTAAGQTPDPTP